jgi:predicted nucleic acid-binding protein
MQKYYDLPMDFADATIVCLAQDLAIKRVVTFDKKDFSIYRLPGKRPFIIFP